MLVAVVVWRTFAYLRRSGGSDLEDICLILAVVVWRTFAYLWQSGSSDLEDICLIVAVVVAILLML